MPEGHHGGTAAILGAVGGYGYDIDHTDEYKAIGRKIYKWLMDEVVNEHTDFIITNFDIDVVATCKGRDFK